jgi:hypothetical protein
MLLPRRRRWEHLMKPGFFVTAMLGGLVLMAACTANPDHNSSSRDSTDARAAPTPTIGSGPSLMLPEVNGDRLARPYSLDGGRIQLAPPPADARPLIDAHVAQSSGMEHGWLDATPRSEVFLAVLTSYMTSRVEATSPPGPNINQQLVWVLFQRDVYQRATGGVRGVTSRTPTTPATAILSVRFNALDARAGTNIEGDYLTNVTDNPARTSPPPY